MSAFKDMVHEDVKEVFMDLDMFGEIHKVNGIEMNVIIDDNELAEREKRIRDTDMGLHNRQFLFYVAAEDFGSPPLPGRELNFDGRMYKITDVANEQGMYSVSLEANAK